MIKRLFIAALIFGAIMSLSSCKADVNYYRGSKGDTAYIRMPNGEVIEATNVTYDYRRDNDFMVVRLEDGTQYFTHGTNVCIVKKTEEE